MNVIITGAASGLGAFLSRKFSLQKQNNVIGIDIISASELTSEFLDIFNNYIEFDLRNTEAIPKMVYNIISETGRVDLFINNAGLKTFGPLTSIDEKIIYDSVNVNYITPILIVQTLLRSNCSCTIINMSSNAAFKAYAEGSIYCSSKAALNSFTEAINCELDSTTVKIYSLCPSTIYTTQLKSKYPLADEKNYISQEQVYREITNIYKNNPKQVIIPVISLKQNLKIIVHDLKRYIFWLKLKLFRI